MFQLEEISRPAQSVNWPEPWRDAPPPPAPPAWYYPPPPWYTPVPVAEPPSQGGTMKKLAYSVDEAAQVLGVSRSTVYKLIFRDGFPSLKVGGRRMIAAELLAEWVRRQAGG